MCEKKARIIDIYCSKSCQIQKKLFYYKFSFTYLRNKKTRNINLF